MGAKKIETIWKIEDVAAYFKVGTSWVYKRIAPNTKYTPKIPRLPGFPQPRFDADEIKSLSFVDQNKSSVKIEKMGNLRSSSSETVRSTQIRRFKKL